MHAPKDIIASKSHFDVSSPLQTFAGKWCVYCNWYEENVNPERPSFVDFNSSFWNGLWISNQVIIIKFGAHLKVFDLDLDASKNTKKEQYTNASLPAIWVVVEAIDGTVATREAHIVETGNSQPTIYPNINKVLLLPPLQHKNGIIILMWDWRFITKTSSVHTINM